MRDRWDACSTVKAHFAIQKIWRNQQEPLIRKKRNAMMPEETQIRVNLAPVVDVTMCLLVFFMLSTRMVERESSTKIDLPVAKAAQDTDRQELGSRFVVNVQDAQLEGGKGVYYIVREQRMTLDEVLSRLAVEKRVSPDVNCIIRGDRTLAFEHVQSIMLGCAQIGVTKVTFSAVPRAPGVDPT